MGIPDVSEQDVADRYEGELLSEFRPEYVRVQVGDAVAYARSRWRAKIESRLASGDLAEELWKRTISDAVLRVLRNPEGHASENEGSYGYSNRASVASGNLWFTDSDIETLAGPERSVGIGTVGIGLHRGWS